MYKPHNKINNVNHGIKYGDRSTPRTRRLLLPLSLTHPEKTTYNSPVFSIPQQPRSGREAVGERVNDQNWPEDGPVDQFDLTNKLNDHRPAKPSPFLRYCTLFVLFFLSNFSRG